VSASNSDIGKRYQELIGYEYDWHTVVFLSIRFFAGPEKFPTSFFNMFHGLPLGRFKKKRTFSMQASVNTAVQLGLYGDKRTPY
jgi:hypothetical protein